MDSSPQNALVAVLLAAIAIQLTAALLAMRLIRVTGRRLAWSLMALALTLMAVRRIVPTWRLLHGDEAYTPDLTVEVIGLLISILAAAGLALIAPIFVERERRAADLLQREHSDLLARQQEGREHLARLHFVESLDRVNRALQSSPDLERALSAVLDVVLSALEADRAFLLHPCDPTAPAWQVPMERTRPEYPGAHALGVEVPMDEEAARVLGALLEADGPVRFDPSTGIPQAESAVQRFGYRSSMMVALHPKVGSPWCFGLHQCSHARVWTLDEATLLREIGHRLQDSLTSLLAYRDLQASERQLRSLVESFPDLLARFDPGGRHMWVSPALARAFDAPPEAFLGRTPLELARPEEREAGRRLLHGVLRAVHEGRPEQVELALGLLAGPRQFELRFYPEKDEAGQVASVLLIARDVTERKAAERQVAVLSFALDKVSEAAYLTDRQGRFLYVNEEACRMLGYARDELLGLAVPDIDPGFLAERWSSHWKEIEARGALLLERPHRAKDGRTVPVELSANHFEFEGRGYNLALARDISERKQAEHVLMRYAAIVESSDDAIVTKTPEGAIDSWNKGAEAVFGYSAAEVVGQPITLLFPPELVDEERRILKEAREGRSVPPYETRRRRKDGRVIDVSVTVSPMRGRDGTLVGVSKIARDVTARKQAEAELAHHRERLEELVAERTAALQAANQELESFSYSVSHDLRTPLRAIDGFSRRLAAQYAQLLDEDGRRLIAVVRDNAARMAKLIDDILAFSRSGRIEMRAVSVDMQRLVEEAWLELEPLRAGRTLRLERQALPPARGDPSLLRQVWVNLLANAVKFSRPRSEARIEVGGSAQGAQQGYYVKDNGVGFDPAYAHKLFGVFQRLHGVEEFEGTGIGLAIVRRIVARHGGQVEAEGRPGEGATFRFSLRSKED